MATYASVNMITEVVARNFSHFSGYLRDLELFDIWEEFYNMCVEFIRVNPDFMFGFLFSFVVSLALAISVYNYVMYYYSKNVAKQEMLQHLDQKTTKKVKFNDKKTIDEINARPMYLHSTFELNQTMNNMVEPYTTYRVLLRIKMMNLIPISVPMQKLHCNNHRFTPNKDGGYNFENGDFFITYSFNMGSKKISFINSIMETMNHINTEGNKQFKSKDFIVIAINKEQKSSLQNEFYQGILNSRYNPKNIFGALVPNSEQKKNANNDNNADDGREQTNKNANANSFVVYYLLPVHTVYDIYMDVFTDVIFESNKYEMDNENYESWNKISINELTF